jgi:hypothetical protein
MPRYPIKPLIQLSKEQWKVLLERVMQKEGKFTTRAAGAVMSRPFEPPVEREVGALFRDVPMGAGEVTRQAERLPIAEARAKYLANPEQYVTPSISAPEMKVMSQVPPGSSEELAAGLAYERVKQVPIVPQASRTARVMSKEIESQELEGAVRRLGVNPEDIRPGVKPQTIIEEMGRKPSEMVTVPPAAELASDAMVADQLWKSMGGGRSLGSKVWEMFRSSSRQKSHINTSRDYFISSFVRWKQAPKHFTKAYPREAKVLNQLWKEFEVSLQPPPVAIPGTNLPGRAGGGVAVGGVE